MYASHSPIHTHIHTHIHTPTAIGCHARYQPARQEQLGVRRLCSGTLRHTQGGIETATIRLPDNSSYLLSHIAPISATKHRDCTKAEPSTWLQTLPRSVSLNQAKRPIGLSNTLPSEENVCAKAEINLATNSS